jgi:predicted amidophosphoribosyltransferase
MMACETVRDTEGHVTMILCGRSRRQTCKFCRNGSVTKLCDYPVAKGNTGMCARCATNLAHEMDYCPTHKHQSPPPQRNLFGE